MWRIFHKILKSLLTLTFFLAFFLVLLLYPVVIVPTMCYRFLLSKYAKLRNPELCEMVEAVGSLLAAEFPFTETESHRKNGHANAFTEMATMETIGDVDIDQADVQLLRENTLEHVVNLKSPDGKLLYPELQQTIKFFKGYAFWCKVPEFCVSRHIRFLHDVQGYEHLKDASWRGENALADLLSSLTRRCWVRGQPLWEMIVIPRVFLEGECNPLCGRSLILFRMHHSLGDALCILRIIPRMGGSDNGDAKRAFCKAPLKPHPDPDQSQNQNQDQNRCLGGILRTMRKIHFLAKIPLEFAHYTATTLMDQGYFNMAHLKELVKRSRESQGESWPPTIGQQALHTAYSRKIPLQVMKDIKNAFGVSFTSLVLATVTTGIREMLVQMGATIPQTMSLGYTLVVPGHKLKDGMRNQVSFMCLRLPTGEPDELKRLQRMNRYMASIRGSSVPLVTRWLSKWLVGLLPTSLIRWFRIDNDSAEMTAIGALANLIGPYEPLQICGREIVGLRPSLNPADDCNGWMFQFVTFNGDARLVASGLSEYWPTREFANDIVKYSEESLKRLHKLALTSNPKTNSDSDNIKIRITAV